MQVHENAEYPLVLYLGTSAQTLWIQEGEYFEKNGVWKGFYAKLIM